MKETERRIRLLTICTSIAALLAVAAIGTVVWIAADPEYWFPGAFAEEGPRGDEGPRGERGPRGPAGPTGEPAPDVADAQDTADEALAAGDDLQTQIDDLGARVDELEGVDTYDLESRVAEVERRVDDACFELSSNTDSFGC